MVSAVIPAYNASRTVAGSVRSVLGQTFGDLELIVVDDGSEDSTPDVVATLDDPRLRIIRQPNSGASAARNAGIASARGQVVAFLDADDLWLPHKLESQLRYLEARPGRKAVQAGAFFVDDRLRVLSARPCAPWKDPLLDVLLFRNLPAFPSTLVASRDELERIGGFDTSLTILEDWNVAIELTRNGSLGSIAEPLVLYRVHPGNRSLDLGIHVSPGHLVLERLFRDPELPPRIRARRRQIYARFYTMLAGGAFRNRQGREWVRWTTRALRTHPGAAGYMVELPFRRLKRLLSRRDPAATVPQ
jgi:glycosyltransferase involved in cell wall biosynthesis